MRTPLILSFVVSAGCAYEIVHQRYGSPTASGATPVLPGARQYIGDGVVADAMSTSPVAIRVPVSGGTVGVAACNLYVRTYTVFLFPPVPVPLWSTTPPRQPLLVALELAGGGTWRVDLPRVALVRAGVSATPARWTVDRGDLGAWIYRGSPEPCRRHPDVERPPPDASIDVDAPGTLWLAFDVDPDPTLTAELRLDGLTRDGVSVAAPHVVLVPGSRSYSFINAP